MVTSASISEHGSAQKLPGTPERKTPLRLEKRPLLVKQLSSSLQVAILEIRSRVLRFLSTHKFFLACAEEKPELKSNSGATFNWGQPATHLARKPSLRKDSRSNLIWVFVTAAPPASQPLATSLQKKIRAFVTARNRPSKILCKCKRVVPLKVLNGCGSKLNRRGYAGFGTCFHLPGSSIVLCK